MFFPFTQDQKISRISIDRPADLPEKHTMSLLINDILHDKSSKVLSTSYHLSTFQSNSTLMTSD